MTPKEKAKELVLKYWNLPIKMNHIIDGVIHIETDKHLYEKDAKQCALIAVDEILNARETVNSHINQHCESNLFDFMQYWQQVKQEIEAL